MKLGTRLDDTVRCLHLMVLVHQLPINNQIQYQPAPQKTHGWLRAQTAHHYFLDGSC